tara:strand:- start:581 stop:736 length:156 start_codon:yes stop_codon:yes gene_type:complete
MEIDYQKGDLVMYCRYYAIIVYADPCDPMVQIHADSGMHWAMRDKIKLVEA